MKQIEKKILITYRWWRNDDKEINPNVVETLEEEANNRINEMRNEDYTSGELNTILLDGDKEIDYQGHWELTTETI